MEKIINKQIIITGGAGFIGSNLCEYFLESNKIICVDDLSTGNKENITPFLNNSNFTFCEGSITSAEFCLDTITEDSVILHNAALGSVSRSIEDPIRSNLNNVTGFLNMLDAARRKNAAKFIYASSSSTYGDSPLLPKTEDRIGNPISPYAVTKLANELYANTFNKVYGTKVIGLRYFNVFGKNQDPNGPYAAVIPRFLAALKENKEIHIYGDGDQTRDFTHVSNVIQAIECAIKCDDEKAFGTVFNVAYGSRISLNELLGVMKEVMEEKGYSPEFNINHKEPRAGDIRDSFASVDKAKKILGYLPSVSLRQGLEKMI